MESKNGRPRNLSVSIFLSIRPGGVSPFLLLWLFPFPPSGFIPAGRWLMATKEAMRKRRARSGGVAYGATALKELWGHIALSDGAMVTLSEIKTSAEHIPLPGPGVATRWRAVSPVFSILKYRANTKWVPLG